MQQVPAFCAQCRSRCGVTAEVEEGRLVAIKADPSHPSGHKICPKGQAAPEAVYAPERLLWPVKRTAPKGAADPGWQRISWEEALQTAAAKLRAAKAAGGAESVAFAVTTPSGTAISDAISWVERLVRAFGSPNTIYGTELCNWHKDIATAFTTGAGIGIPDFAHSDCVVLWGHNPLATWLAHAGEVQKGLKAGAKLVVVDPRKVGFARRADSWLRVRPGTDLPLALGLANLLIEAEAYDADFLRDWTGAPFLVREDSGRFLRSEDLGEAEAGLILALGEDGGLLRYDPARRSFREAGARPALGARVTLGGIACASAFTLYAELCAAYPPAVVECLTDVPEDDLRAAATLLGEAKTVAHYAWTGVGQGTQATQVSRAMALLVALKGCHDAPGGNVLQPGPALNDVSGRDLVTPEQRAKTLGLKRLPLGPGRDGWVTGRDVYHAILEGEPYPVTALVGFGSNLLLSQPEAELAGKALEKLDFYLHVDSQLTPTAAYADIVLPAATAWEREGLRNGFDCSLEGQARLQLKPAVIPPQGESRPDTEIAFALARALGLEELFFGGDPEAGLAHQLAPLGLTPEDLRAAPEGLTLDNPPRYRRHAERDGEGRPAGFKTPTGRIEIYSEQLLEIGQAPLPVPAEAGREAARGAEGFDLTLTCAKTVAYCHSQFRHLPSLRKLMPDPQLEVHQDLAAARGIAEKDWVSVVTPNGRFRARVRIGRDMHPSTVCGQHGWWQACETLGAEGFPAAGEGSANVNQAVNPAREDPISGSLPLRATPCRIEVLPAGAVA